MAIFNQCNPLYISVDGPACGCSLTRADIKAMTPQDFEDLFWKEVGMSRVVAATKEARIVGVKQSAMQDLLLSRMRPAQQNILNPGQGQSIIAPFIYAQREAVVNDNYFVVQSGGAPQESGLPADAWKFLISANYDSTGSNPTNFGTNLPNVYKYFVPGRYFVVIYKDTNNGNVGRIVQFKVISAQAGTGQNANSAVVIATPGFKDDDWATYPYQSVYHPTHGLVILLTNSVSDYESWCQNGPAIMSKTLKAIWFQTERRTFCYNDQYLKVLEAPNLDPLFKSLRLMPIAQQKAQEAERAERAFWNTVWFGREIDPINQTVSTYTKLPQVVDPADPSCLIEYKANTLGIMRQLEECNRVVDFNGATLNFDMLAEAGYVLRRRRKTTEIDCMTDRFTAANILSLMIRYYKDKYGYETTRFYQPNQAIKFENQVLWNYNKYEFPEHGFVLNVITDDFFDDHLSAMPTTDKSMGRYLMLIDWTTVNIGLSRARSVTRKTNEADNIYNCVITPNVTHYQLWSQTFAVDVQDPTRSLIFYNFSDACPRLTSYQCEPV